MKKYLHLILLIPLLLSMMLISHVRAATDGSGATVNVSVMGCNNNAICEHTLGEDISNCPIDCTPEPQTPSTGGTTGGSSPIPAFEYYDLKVTPYHNYAVISWKTTQNALTTFSWGKSPDYEQGSISGVSYIKTHQVKIENLDEATRYYYKIQGNDAIGNGRKIEDSFVTLHAPDLNAPSNVTNLTLTEIKERNLLKWQNPIDEDFMYVRVVRSTKNFPLDGLSGRIVYEGRGNYAYDDAVSPGVRYYYTVFAFDRSGNASSGATVASKRPVIENPLIPPGDNPYRDLTLHDFGFAQDNKSISFKENTILVIGDFSLHITLPSHKLNIKPHLILLDVMFGPEHQTMLIREYGNKNGYETIINFGNYAGSHPFKIYFIDEKLTVIHELEGTFDVSAREKKDEKIPLSNYTNFIFGDPIIAVSVLALLLAIILLLILVILWINRKRKRAILIAPNEPN